LKSSLQTYLNAMTYPDRTVYPVASPNATDFRHLVDVYLDAVLRPRLQVRRAVLVAGPTTNW
jgi:Zn-dependent M16 (insulinase) family peptidase